MSFDPFTYKWSLLLAGSPEILWPLITDTDRFDRDAGIPEIQKFKETLRSGLPMVEAEFDKYGFHFAYSQEPFEWHYPTSFNNRRIYHQGVIKELKVSVQLIPQGSNQTQLDYQVQVTPRNILGKLAIPYQIGYVYHRNFLRIFKNYSVLATNQEGWQSSLIKPTLELGGLSILNKITDKLVAFGFNKNTVIDFMYFIQHADESFVHQLRPYEVAKIIKHPSREVLDMCLQATRLGLFELQWQLLCPLCRAPKDKAGSLQDLASKIHCEVCKIDVSANFENAVELTFQLQSTVRKTKQAIYCIGGPQHTPHIVLQKKIKPGEIYHHTYTLEPDRYRLRILGKPCGIYFKTQDDGIIQFGLKLSEPWPQEELTINSTWTLELNNTGNQEESLCILELLSWSVTAVTAGELFTSQTFRDLFSKELIRNDYQISVGSVAILFTDLCGSTAMYQNIGDAPAFGRVLSHFELLKQIIHQQQGAIVKTIGDAIMAVFKKPGDAIRAMALANAKMETTFNKELTIKSSLHYGPAIAVNLNDRLDYFGSTVNMAARLEKYAEGKDVVISDEVLADDEVQELIRDQYSSRIHSQSVNLKGFANSWMVHRIIFE